ncbi:SurA N-terminal domain-containing protein [Desulfosarcina alkanivorans]|nr:SurA N-terminal domain-containing protein [Desulfosarcina alkanivorans]
MRKHAGSWMIKVVLFAIVIVFVFWGVGSFRSREASKVATVNDEIITVVDYRRAYNNMLDQYRQRFGSSLNDDMIEMLQIKKQALDQLIDRKLLLQEAEHLGLRVSDSEIADSIINTQVFQNNGSFDNRRYRRLLAQVHLTPEEYETDQKQVLLGGKLSRIVMGAAKVSDQEARQWYDWQNASVSVDYVLFEPARYTGIDPSEEAISTYFDANKETYKTDPMVNVRYVVFEPDTYRDQVTVDEDELLDYYETNLAEFKTEKTVEARHVLIKLDANADEDADQAAKSRAEEVAKMARAGQDFAELAQTYSEGPTKDRGGYLGKFQRSQMVRPFADQAFSMAAGDVSDPVKTQFGWHVIKVESVEAASTKTLEESKDRIVKTLTDRKSRNLAYDTAEQFYEGCFEKDDLVNNAKTFKLAVMEAGPFSRVGPEVLGTGKGAFANAAFALKADEISDIQDIDGRYYLIQQTETIDAAIPGLETVTERVKADLTKKIQADKAKADADAMAAALSEGGAFDQIAAQRGATVKNTGLFARSAAIPDIGSDPEFSEAAFQLSSVGDTSGQPVRGGAGFYLMRLAERKAPDAGAFESEKESIRSMLLRQKQRTVFQDWIDSRKADSQIIIEEAYLE